MERLLIGLENKYGSKEEERRRRARSRTKDVAAADLAATKAATMTTTTTVVNAITPLDSLEERSRETDSHSTPHWGSGGGNSSNERRTGAADPVTARDAPHANGTQSSYGAETPRGALEGAETSPSATSSAPPTHEELHRRYLSINTPRRDEYSARVLNALLDAWPKSVKTSSEGGRLPLHMACFGRATVRVMETVLKAYPDAARQRNHDGFLPVHIAAHWGVSHPDVAPLLLRAYPDGAVGRNRWERTPIEEALGMAGENGRDHQLSLVWSLRRHPTYWIHNDVGAMLAPGNVRGAPWRMADAGDEAPDGDDGGDGAPGARGRRSCDVVAGGAVDVDEVGSSDDEDEGVEVQIPQPQSSHARPSSRDDPAYVRALAESAELSLLITRDRHWGAAALRCRTHPNEARETLEVRVRGAYTARITPLHYACEQSPSADAVRALLGACPKALGRRQEPGGQLPLHAACTWGASLGAVGALLEARPETAEMKDFLSNLPLHCACYSGAETKVVAALLIAYPQGVWPRNHQGSSAVDIARRLGHGNRREVLGLLERTMGRLLERAAAGEEEGVEVDR